MGVIQPIDQASKMVQNSKMDRPTLAAKDVAMRLARSVSLPPFLIMKTKAVPRLPKMATNAMMAMYFMCEIIP